MNRSISPTGFAPLRPLILLPLIAMVVSCGPSSIASEGDPERRARLAENLQFVVPQLRNVDVVVTELRPGAGDLDEGTLQIGEQRTMRFVVTRDDKKLYLLATDPIDASKSSAEIAALMNEEDQASLSATLDRASRLLDQSAGQPVRGEKNAPITIVEFSDFQCPYCARASSTVEEVLERYPGDIRLVYMHFPLGNHPWAIPAAVASICAAEQSQDAFWQLHDYFFGNQDEVNMENVLRQARLVVGRSGIDSQAWSACAEDERTDSYKKARALVDRHLQIGRDYGITGTPAFYVNGRFINGAKPVEDFEAAIREAKRDGLTEGERAALDIQEQKAELAERRSRHSGLLQASVGLPSRGNAAAAVTIVEFSDFECPFCAKASRTIDEVMDTHAGDVRLVYMHFPLGIHPWAMKAAIASECVAKQNQDVFWRLHDFYFDNQSDIEVGNVIEKTREVLSSANVDLAAWTVCAEDESSITHKNVRTSVERQARLARENGLTGTPGFFVNGQFINGAKPVGVFEEAIRIARAEAVEM